MQTKLVDCTGKWPDTRSVLVGPSASVSGDHEAWATLDCSSSRGVLQRHACPKSARAREAVHTQPELQEVRAGDEFDEDAVNTALNAL